jgi:hypothetical protein
MISLTQVGNVYDALSSKADSKTGAAGLSLSYALTFTDYVLWIVRLWAACEQNLTSVERLGECKPVHPGRS